MATLTYVYADSTAVLGPLALQVTPGCYDLCAAHSASMSAPVGWEVIRLAEPNAIPPGPDDDDLLALANAVREIGFGTLPPATVGVSDWDEVERHYFLLGRIRFNVR